MSVRGKNGNCLVALTSDSSLHPNICLLDRLLQRELHVIIIKLTIIFKINQLIVMLNIYIVQSDIFRFLFLQS